MSERVGNLRRILDNAIAKYPDAPPELLAVVEARAIYHLTLRGFHHAMRELDVAERELCAVDMSSRIDVANVRRRAFDAKETASAWADLVHTTSKLVGATQEKYRLARIRHEDRNERLGRKVPFYMPPEQRGDAYEGPDD